MSAIDQRVALTLYLAMVGGGRGGFVEVRYRRSNGMGQLWHPARHYRILVETVESLGRRTDTYVGAAARVRKHGRVDAIDRVKTLWADCDEAESVRALAEFEPAPSVVIRSGSGGHVHAYWPLRTGVDPQGARRANRRLAHALGADMASTDAARIMRPPATFNHKSDPARPVVCTRIERDSFWVGEVVADLPDPPVDVPDPPKRPLDAGGARAGDPLLTISPREYVPALVGRELGRDGKLACPFHEDWNPSLHAYPDAAQGWFCFQCLTGGSLIDLAARLYGIEPRGAGYFEVRRRAAAALLGVAA